MYIYIVSSVSLPRTSQRGKLVPANEHVQLHAIYIIYVCVYVYNYTRCFDGHTHMYTLTIHL